MSHVCEKRSYVLSVITITAAWAPFFIQQMMSSVSPESGRPSPQGQPTAVSSLPPRKDINSRSLGKPGGVVGERAPGGLPSGGRVLSFLRLIPSSPPGSEEERPHLAPQERLSVGTRMPALQFGGACCHPHVQVRWPWGQE